jgi:antitoxin MazE
MITKVAVNKWGNSYGIRVPKAALEALSIVEAEKLDLVVTKKSLVFKKAEGPKGTAERLANYTGDYRGEEFDTGKPVGNEVW